MTAIPPGGDAGTPQNPPEAAKKKKLPITANQVTVARILALPFPCWALLARPEPAVMWVAFFFGALVGCTDFVDGWMARRDGSTTLGALLDPVADKLFIAMLLLPCVANADCPGWAAGALFVRELLITSLRSSLARRQTSLKTSQLGKLKTVVQMGGIAAFFLTVFVPADSVAFVEAACGAAFVVLAVWWYVRRRQMPLWLAATPLLLFTIAAIAQFGPGTQEEAAKLAGTSVFLLMVLFTWISGADYLTGSVRALRATGGIQFPDVVRVGWSIAHGLALVPLLGDHRYFDVAHPLRGLALPVIVSLCAELSLGGLENMVTEERRRFARGSVLPTFLAAVVVGVCAWFELAPASVLELAAWGLALFSVVNLVVAFVLDRDVFFAPHQPVE